MNLNYRRSPKLNIHFPSQEIIWSEVAKKRPDLICACVLDVHASLELNYIQCNFFFFFAVMGFSQFSISLALILLILGCCIQVLLLIIHFHFVALVVFLQFYILVLLEHEKKKSNSCSYFFPLCHLM